ncbi:MAG: aldehyde reductase [Bacteroidota bacterium]
MDNSKLLVLVTGGTGFLGSHCIFQLLKQGYRVRTTVRNIAKKETLIQTLEESGTKMIEHLSFVEADLNQDKNWKEAAKHADYILHVASPFPAKMPKDEKVLLTPAVEGTLRVLKAASEMGVKRVVLTSSFAAIGYSQKASKEQITEEDWTDPNNRKISSYTKSKTLAERAAWEFIRANHTDLELSTICPRFILGPSLGNRFTTSLSVLGDLFNGTMRAFPNVSYGIIDVRDVADLHIRAMTNSNANNQRFIASSGHPMTFKEIALFLRQELGQEGKRISTKVYPNWLVRLAALFYPAAKGVVPNLGKTLISKNDKAINLLGWNPRSREEAILASIQSIMKYNRK